jgi:phospholipid transport system transporter-binding protein
VLLLPATLSAREARDTLRMLKQALEQERGANAVVVDAGPLQRFDSSALAVLLEIDRLAQAWGREFAIRSAPAKLAALAKLYGVDALLLKAEGPPAAATAGAGDQRRPAT